LKEAIIISTKQRFPTEWTDEVMRELDREGFKVKVVVTEEPGAMAALEWAIPTMVVAYLLKPFFEAFFTEAGKDFYEMTKAELKKFITRNKAVKFKYIAATTSPNKLSQSYDQSLTISLKAQIHDRLTLTVLFNENTPEQENEQLLEGMFQYLDFFYRQAREQGEPSASTHQKLSPNEVYMIANNETKQWEILTGAQMRDKYRNKTQPAVSGSEPEHETVIQAPNSNIVTGEIFMSYSWDSPEHQQKVINLTNHLRTNGFNAVIDKMISQEKTAVNFVRMMHQAMASHRKIIVILSAGYKMKAETFTGGVGEEYEILINDIKKNEQKYILASFDGRGDDIVPLGLVGRDIVDLSKPGEQERLFEKLLDHKRYEFAEVGAHKPQLTTVSVQGFQVAAAVPVIPLPPVVKQTGNAGFMGQYYRDIELIMDFKFKNVSKKSVDGFAYEILVHRFLIEDYYRMGVSDDTFTFNEAYQAKVFAGQECKVKQLKFKVDTRTIHQLINSTITMKAFTDDGEHKEIFMFKDVVKVRPLGHYTAETAVPISKDLFVDE
jgi:hypothetical protein